MAIQLAVFDLAGTTVNDPGGVNSCLRGALKAVGLTVEPAAVDAVMGLPKPVSIRLLIESAGRAELLPRIASIHEAFVASMLTFYRSDPSVYEIPGTSETFKRLHQAGIAVAVDTGFNRVILDVILERLGWTAAGLVRASVASDEVSRGRPHADMILHLMKLLGVTDSRRVAKVGDTPADLGEGTAAGCGFVIGVTRGTHTREQLAGFPHTHLIESVAEVPGLLGC